MEDLLKLGYPEGYNLTIMNTMYLYPTKNEETGKYEKDKLLIIYKDNTTGEKKWKLIEEPEYIWYLLKPEIQATYNMAFVPIDDVIPIKCKYRDITKSIAEETGNKDLYNENIKSGNYKLNRIFMTHPRAFSSDMNIMNFARSRFAEMYENPVIPIDICFFDIETDIINSAYSYPVIGECPVNAISMYHTKTNTIYNFVSRQSEIPNPQIKNLEDNISANPEFYKKKVQDFIEYDLGSKEKVKKYRLENVNLSVGFFDSEIEMIIAFFGVLHKLEPDFAVAYNISFDLPTLAERIKINGYDPRDIICDSDIPLKHYEYFIDMNNKNNYEDRGDYAAISSRIAYIDQMITYASRRKGQGAIGSYKLDNVAELECGVHKLDYHDITSDIAKLPYKDFETFWLYNIIDVIAQACIEAQTEDFKYLFNNAIEMNVPYQKVFRQTNYLATKATDFYKHHEGYIMGNNVNGVIGKKPTEKFPGAFVAKATLISNKNKSKQNGIYINKLNNANDFDYKRLYPSLLQEFNMATNTQIGMIKFEGDNAPYKDPSYLRIGPGGTFNENLASYNYIEFCKRWMNLPDVEDAIKDIKEYIRTRDNTKKRVVTLVNQNQVIGFKRKMPDWVKQEVDNIRGRIEIK